MAGHLIAACSPSATQAAATTAEVSDYVTELATCRRAALAADAGFASYEPCAEGVDRKFGVKVGP